MLFKSKKPISFSTLLEIENNFGKKYEIKLNGTSSKSALLKCDKLADSTTSMKSVSCANIKSVANFSLKSLAYIDAST